MSDQIERHFCTYSSFSPGPSGANVGEVCIVLGSFSRVFFICEIVVVVLNLVTS